MYFEYEADIEHKSSRKPEENLCTAVSVQMPSNSYHTRCVETWPTVSLNATSVAIIIKSHLM
jgi:hypothetical protein